MMVLNSLILFATALLGGLLVYALPKLDAARIRLPLVFAGSYLFSITIIHILPELFHTSEDPQYIGLLVLGGFMFQYILEFVTAGVEHGHVHHHSDKHQHSTSSIYFLMIGLSVHALLEGTLVAHPSAIHEQHDSSALLIGIVLHKMPAAFALMSLLTCEFATRPKPILLLIIFSLMSPLGLWIGDFLLHTSESLIVILFAIVSGSFLHISTTIFFESTPGHRWSFSKILITLLGISLAILAEWVL